MSKISELMQWNRFSPVSIRQGDQEFSIATLQEEVNRLFEHFYRGMQVHMTDWDALPETAPAINVTETAGAFKVDVALPGMDPADIDVEIAGSLLTIKGRKSAQEEQKEEKAEAVYLRREIALGSFLRTIALPETADADKAKARFANGVLGVTVPKKAESVRKPRKVDIKDAA